jgi:hypothetical protein
MRALRYFSALLDLVRDLAQIVDLSTRDAQSG